MKQYNVTALPSSLQRLVDSIKANAERKKLSHARTSPARGKNALALKMKKPIGLAPCYHFQECRELSCPAQWLDDLRVYCHLCPVHQH